MSKPGFGTTRGFTLPIVLVAMAGMLILLGGLMIVVGLEQRSARAHANAYRADLAARSAMAEVRTVLSEFTADDTYTVVRAPIRVQHDDDGDGRPAGDLDGDGQGDEDVERPYLFLVRSGLDGALYNYDYEPLFSAETKPESTNILEMPDDPGLPADTDDRTSFRPVRSEKPPVLAWRYIEDDEGKKVARYAYWVEDTQSYLEAGEAGNALKDDRHARANELWPDDWRSGWPSPTDASDRYPPPWPAPGVNPDQAADDPSEPESNLNQAAVYAIDPGNLTRDTTEFDDVAREGGETFAQTPESLLAYMDVPAPLLREPVTGRLIDQRARQAEENLFAGNQPYEEQALIPYVNGVGSSMAGQPKLNLNRLLQEDPPEAVAEMKQHIRNALPEFSSLRRGGFPEDYEATLAASILDYADVDSTPIVEEGEYRGIDSFPLVNEFLLTITWRWLDHSGDFDAGSNFPWSEKSFFRENGRLYVLFTVELFAELWNMSPLPVEGDYQFNYETHYSFPYGSNPEISFMDEEMLDRPFASINPDDEQSGSHHNLAKDGKDGRYYFPPVSIALDGNEHRVVRLGSVRYKIDVAPAAAFLPGQIDTLGGDDGQSSYVMRWNGQLADWSRGGLERLDINRLRNGNYPETRANICGGSFGEYGGFYNGMGDVRICYYAETMQSSNSYPQNYSPNRRNVRYGSIYSRNPNTIYGRVLPSEWPDGGHDADFGEGAYRRNRTTDRSRRPDDARFLVPHPGSEPDKAPLRVSNLGRYYSETELGRIFDPAMWAERSSRPAIQQWTEEIEIRGVEESSTLGGGNTLRIGRPEHAGFSSPDNLRPGVHAARLLDLFHCGKPFSERAEEREGNLVEVRGRVNVNTAPRDVLRALAAGSLVTDPRIGIESGGHDTRGTLAPRIIPAPMAAPKKEIEADVIADAIIAGRPYASPSELAEVTDSNRQAVFGNTRMYPRSNNIQWSDAAAEEVFARVYNSATVRSRNFRVFVIGQAVQEIGRGDVKVLSTRRKMFQVFTDPGERDEAGALQPDNLEVEVLYERDL